LTSNRTAVDIVRGTPYENRSQSCSNQIRGTLTDKTAETKGFL